MAAAIGSAKRSRSSASSRWKAADSAARGMKDPETSTSYRYGYPDEGAMPARAQYVAHHFDGSKIVHDERFARGENRSRYAATRGDRE